MLLGHACLPVHVAPRNPPGEACLDFPSLRSQRRRWDTEPLLNQDNPPILSQTEPHSEWIQIVEIFQVDLLYIAVFVGVITKNEMGNVVVAVYELMGIIIKHPPVRIIFKISLGKYKVFSWQFCEHNKSSYFYSQTFIFLPHIHLNIKLLETNSDISIKKRIKYLSNCWSASYILTFLSHLGTDKTDYTSQLFRK